MINALIYTTAESDIARFLFGVVFAAPESIIESGPIYRHFGKNTAIVLSAVVIATDVQAQLQTQTPSQEGKDKGIYTPTIWVDPDGCEHWVMDDGAEGYMMPHTNRLGIPVCRRCNVCGMMQSDQFFATDSHRIHKAARHRLAKFFQETGAVSYIITGHTDSRASDAYNMRLSFRRATAVARIAAANGASVADVCGYGERLPVAANTSSQGMAKNCRVEIICIR